MESLLQPCPCQEDATRAFTLVELTVVILTVALVFLFLTILLFYPAKEKSHRIACVNNLKNVGLGFRIFASANSNLFPMQKIAQIPDGRTATVGIGSRTVVEYFQSLSNELGTPVLLHCPADSRKRALSFAELKNGNVSYFVGVDSNGTAPTSLLVGDRNLATNGIAIGPGLAEITKGMSLGWTKDLHRFRGNVVLGDGSVQQFSNERLSSFLPGTGLTTNRIIIP